MGGNSELYRQILKEYYNENKDTSDKLCLNVSEKRYADAAQIVHKVKSSSGSIGAKRLYDLSIKLQKALDDEKEDKITVLKRSFSNMLNNLLEEIAKLQD